MQLTFCFLFTGIEWLFDVYLFLFSYVTILPSIHLSIAVNPERAIGIRHVAETKATSYLFHSARLTDKEVPGEGLDPLTILSKPNLSSPLEIVVLRLVC